MKASGSPDKQYLRTENSGGTPNEESGHLRAAKAGSRFTSEDAHTHAFERTMEPNPSGFDYQKASAAEFLSSGNAIFDENPPSVSSRLNAFQIHADQRFADLYFRLEYGITTSNQRFQAVADKIDKLLPEIAKINLLLPQLLAETKNRNAKDVLMSLSKELNSVSGEIQAISAEAFRKPPNQHDLMDNSQKPQETLMLRENAIIQPPYIGPQQPQELHTSTGLDPSNSIFPKSTSEYAYIPETNRPAATKTVAVKKLIRFIENRAVLKLQNRPNSSSPHSQQAINTRNPLGSPLPQYSNDAKNTNSFTISAGPGPSDSMSSHRSSSSSSKATNLMSQSSNTSFDSLDRDFQGHDESAPRAEKRLENSSFVLSSTQPSTKKHKTGILKQKDDSRDSLSEEVNEKGLFSRPRRKSSVTQYKLEKSLKSVQEIWQEYEYGLQGKPPLKILEAKFSAKWRDETESRTFLRRKKIYEAIENGIRNGYDEAVVIDELEEARVYSSRDAIKKRSLHWLYTNIPPKFSRKKAEEF